MKYTNGLISALLAGLLAAGAASAQEGKFDELLKTVKDHTQQVSKENQGRERRFVEDRDGNRALLQQARSSLNSEESRSQRLKTAFEQNEKLLEELSDTLRIRVGNFGELFGVVRQVAGDTKGVIESSLISAQYPNRGELANRLAQISGLPSIEDLNDLRGLLIEEMIQAGEVVRFPSDIISADGEATSAEVIRVGVFNVITGDSFLRFEPETGSLRELPRQPAGRFRAMAGDLFSASVGETVAMAVDPSRGSLLGLLIQAPSFSERIQQGGLVGYVIIALGLLGVLVAGERLLTLTLAGGKISKQLRSDSPSDDNALGRILKVYHDGRDIDTETLELKLDEAILHETPRLEKRQGMIKVFAAVAPLLGLLGTVVGMIATFQAITLFGTGDPKLMAGGISQALMTTVLGLCVAIPLVLLHSVVAGRSKSLIEILEEQSAGIIAKHSESETAL